MSHVCCNVYSKTCHVTVVMSYKYLTVSDLKLLAKATVDGLAHTFDYDVSKSRDTGHIVFFLQSIAMDLYTPRIIMTSFTFIVLIIIS